MTQWSSPLRTWPPAPTASMLLVCPTGRHQKVSWQQQELQVLVWHLLPGVHPSLSLPFMSLCKARWPQRWPGLGEQYDHAQPRNELSKQCRANLDLV